MPLASPFCLLIGSKSIGINVMPVASTRFPRLSIRSTTSLLSSGILAVPVISNELSYFQRFHWLIIQLPRRKIPLK
ncbi:hypothetical protein CE330_14220 [Salmonella enterica]|nr:hypothetical protein [Salmonella enterica]